MLITAAGSVRVGLDPDDAVWPVVCMLALPSCRNRSDGKVNPLCVSPLTQIVPLKRRGECELTTSRFFFRAKGQLDYAWSQQIPNSHHKL